MTKGIWAIWPANLKIPANLLSNKALEGMAARFTWNFIQSSPGFKASEVEFLDSVVADAGKNGKKVSFNLICGESTPSWVYREGAERFRTAAGTSIPVPWNPTYLTHLGNLIKKLGERYANEPHLVHVKLNGMNYESGELRLPTTPSDLSQWKSIGCNHDRLVDAFTRIESMWASAFKTQELVLPIQPSGLPKLNGANPVDTIIEHCYLTRPSRFILANHALSAKPGDWVAQPLLDHAKKGGRIGFQMLGTIVNNIAYRMSGGMVKPYDVILREACERGFNAGAKYLEIYNQDTYHRTTYPVIEEYANKLK